MISARDARAGVMLRFCHLEEQANAKVAPNDYLYSSKELKSKKSRKLVRVKKLTAIIRLRTCKVLKAVIVDREKSLAEL